VAALVGDQTGVVGSSGDTAMTVSAAPKPTRRKHGLGLWLPVAWISVIVVGSLLAPWLPLKPNEKTLGKAGLMPNSKFWLGTDQIGRDIFSRVLWGGRVALAVGVVSVISAMVVGGALGLFAGFYRGRLEAVLNTIVNTLLAFPALVLVLAITAFLGHNLWNIVTAIAIVAIPAFARIAYANTLTVSQREYVLAARSLGATNGRILFREILPNVVLPLSAFALVVTAVAIVAEAGLAFVGLSIQRPKPSWGSMIDDGRKLLVGKGIWHVTFIPIGVMFLTVLSINLIGDRLQSIIDGRDAKI
jgi:peptide/nickel transport system permease protein